MRRSWIWFLLTPLFLLVAVALAYAWHVSNEWDRLGDALVEEVAAAPHEFSRPSHLDPPEPGTFGDAISPELPALAVELAAWKAIDDEALTGMCTEVRDGKLPWPELPAACVARMERGTELALRTLQAGRRERAGLPPGLRWLSDPADPLQRDGLLRLQHAARLGALHVRRLVVQGRPDDALTVCEDGLAFSRDVAYGAGLLGAMVSAATTRMYVRPCAAAMSEATPERARLAVARLARIRAALPPLSRAMEDEWRDMPLRAYGQLLSDVQLARLPPEARAITATEGAHRVSNGFERLLMRHAWAEMTKLRDSLIASVDLPRSERAAKVAEVTAQTGSSLNPIVRIGMPDYSKFADRRDEQLASLDVVIAAGRLGTGGPLNVEGATPLVLTRHEDGLHLRAEDAALEVELRLQVPRPEGREPRR